MASGAPVTPAPGEWTYERYLQLEGEWGYEVHDGELVMVPAPGTRHQRVVRDLSLRIIQFVEAHAAGEAWFSPVDVVLSDRVVVQPDIVFVRRDNLGIVDERAVNGPPDLVVEVLSPPTLRADRHRKRELYRRFGVPEYWIVDPANRSIEVLSLEAEGYVLSSFAAGSGVVGSRVLPGLEVAVEEVAG